MTKVRQDKRRDNSVHEESLEQDRGYQTVSFKICSCPERFVIHNNQRHQIADT